MDFQTLKSKLVRISSSIHWNHLDPCWIRIRMKKEEMVYCLNKAKDLDFLKGSLIVSEEVTPASNGDFTDCDEDEIHSKN